MPSERIQRRIDAFLDQAEVASDASDWVEMAAKARAVLAVPPALPPGVQALGDVAERRREREHAMEYLDRAGERFGRRGTKLYLDQVRARKEALGA